MRGAFPERGFAKVLLLAEGNRFRCPLARFVLGPDGSLERVRLIGAVTGELSIEEPVTPDGVVTVCRSRSTASR